MARLKNRGENGQHAEDAAQKWREHVVGGRPAIYGHPSSHSINLPRVDHYDVDLEVRSPQPLVSVVREDMGFELLKLATSLLRARETVPSSVREERVR